MARKPTETLPKNRYDAEFHCKLLKTLMSQGNDIATFCAGCEIARATFYNWIAVHKEFSETYDIAREMCRAWWEGRALEGIIDVSFNTTLWSINMRNRFGYTEHRKVKMELFKDAKTPQEQMKSLFFAIATGEITGPEAMQFSNMVLAGIKIDEQTETKNDVKQLLEIAKSKQ